MVTTCNFWRHETHLARIKSTKPNPMSINHVQFIFLFSSISTVPTGRVGTRPYDGNRRASPKSISFNSSEKLLIFRYISSRQLNFYLVPCKHHILGLHIKVNDTSCVYEGQGSQQTCSENLCNVVIFNVANTVLVIVCHHQMISVWFVWCVCHACCQYYLAFSFSEYVIPSATPVVNNSKR